MPKVFISPSNQYFNTYYSGNGNEGMYMNLLADIMIPYFTLNGVETLRRDKNSTVLEAIADSNQYRPDLHIALHSNASPDNVRYKGPEVYYFEGSQKGLRAANAIADRLKEIYPNPSDVKVIPVTDELAEIKGTTSPAVYIEVGYHDERDDEQWIVNNLNSIARAIVLGTLDYCEE